MPFMEAPTNFYLGRRYDPSTTRLTDDVVYYDSRDLTTHAVVVGMTGSGKTGLCITLLEEAILDNIPAIIIDPKGDITNLLLSFPDLKPQDFQPWVNIDDAHRAGLDLPNFAADVAQRWKDGLHSWGIVPDRIRWLQMATKYSIFTPGSDSGLPISILASLKAPKGGWAGNEEANREKINGITTALLALAGINAEPVTDKEHVLIANIFENAWQYGQDLTLEDIIAQIQNPPFTKLGVMPINDYMKERDRFKLAMSLNSIIAAPSFQSWMDGQPLDIQSLLYQPNGRPRVSIFYISHLNEQERMFITTLILENMLSWMRTQSGTTSLRAILYIDEMFGYFPPYPKNPPTKEPLLRLLKQARAFGLGLVLATQNPGDLDYKGLTNAGTWFIGRLQSENDQKKVIAGLESMANADDDLSMRDVGTLISDITPRVFLMRNVHDTGGPILLHTRWAMSYLRGPLTRQQIGSLMRKQRQELMTQVAQQYSQQVGGYGQQQSNMPPPPQGIPGMPTGAPNNFTMPSQSAQYAPPPPPPGYAGAHPQFGQGGGQFNAQATPQQGIQQTPSAPVQKSQVTDAPAGFSRNAAGVSASIAQYFLPNELSVQQAVGNYQSQTQVPAQQVGNGVLVYRPTLLAQAIVRYQDRKASIYTAYTFTYKVPDLQQAGLIHWDEYESRTIEARSVQSSPAGDVFYGDLPPGLTDNSRMRALKTEIVDMLYNTKQLVIPYNPDLKIYGDPTADFSQYQAQVQQLAREQRDLELDKISQKYDGLADKVENNIRKKEQELRAEEGELKDRRYEQLFTAGEAFLSLRKGRSNYTLSRMSRTNRYRRQTKDDIDESYETLEALEQDMQQLEAQYQRELQTINDKWVKIATNVQEYMVTPYKKDIQLELFGIGWIPYWYVPVNGQPMLLSAY